MKSIILQFVARNKRLKERDLTYQDYLKSDNWKELKAYLKTKKRFQQCFVCETNKFIVFHHMTYLRIWTNSFRKRANDIIPLCNNCHQKVHNLCNEKGFGLKQSVKVIKKLWITEL